MSDVTTKEADIDNDSPPIAPAILTTTTEQIAEDNPPSPVPVNAAEDEEVAPTTATHKPKDIEDEFVWPVTPRKVAEQSPRMTGIIPLQSGPVETYDELFIEAFSQLGEAEFFARAEVPGSRENLLLHLTNFHSNHAAASQTSINRIANVDGGSQKFDYHLRDPETGKAIFGPGPRTPSTDGDGRFVTGEAGKVSFYLAQRGNVRHQQLYNSGFSVDIRDPTANEIATVINRAQVEVDKFGRMLGAHFYSQAGILVQEVIADFILNELVISSDLKQWNNRDVLRQSIKLPDLDVLIWATACLMYPDGFQGFRHVCNRPITDEHPTHCNCTTQIEKISLTKLLRNNFQALNPTAIAHMMRSTSDQKYTITKSMLDEYHTALGFDGRTVTFQNIQATLKVPSLDQYFRYGRAFLATLLEEFPANKVDSIVSSIHYKFSQQLLPYVHQLSMLKADGTKMLNTTDEDVIRSQLDWIDTRDTQEAFRKALIDFAYESKISHVCYPSFVCPTCGYDDPSAVGGFFTLDPTSTFFTMGLKKLSQT